MAVNRIDTWETLGLLVLVAEGLGAATAVRSCIASGCQFGQLVLSSLCSTGSYCSMTISIRPDKGIGTTFPHTGRVHCIRCCIGYRLDFSDKVIPM